jgi:hypothetical protein
MAISFSLALTKMKTSNKALNPLARSADAPSSITRTAGRISRQPRETRG